MKKEYIVRAELYEIEPEPEKRPSVLTLILTLIPLFLGLIFWLAVVAFALLILYILIFVI